MAVEKFYTRQEVASIWGVSPDTITRIFENEPGVLVLGSPVGTRSKHRKRHLRIPESVVEKVRVSRAVA